MTSILFKRLALASLLAVAALAAVRFDARAQQTQPAVTINQLDATAYPELRAVVTALDASGVPEQGLTLAQFQAYDGDTPLTVTGLQSAQDASLKLSVVLAIDVSGSMAGEPLDSAKQAAGEFIRALGPNDEAAIVAFNATVTPVVPFTNDRAKLTNGIAGLQAGGGTALFEAVQAATYAARSTTSPRRAVVILSDGQNDAQGSTATAGSSFR
jgi:VWFA-related protein